MLDLEFICENAEAVKENCRRRGIKADVDRLIELAGRRSKLIQEVDEVRRRQNEIAGAIPKEKDAAKKQALVAEGRKLKEGVSAKEEDLRQAAEELRGEWRKVPNMTHPAAPVGKDETANVEVRRWGEPRRFDFKPLDHVELGERLDLIDFEGGARVAGQSFYFLKNEAVLLELALVRYGLEILLLEGFTPAVTPDLARDEVLEGIGFTPRGPETQIYAVEGSDLCLVATAEITLGGWLRDQILEEEQLPIKLAGLSHCFRTEAGAHGKATRGLYRVHQFTKLEMFAFTRPEESDEMLEQLARLEERIFQGLGIPYRVVDTCTGDLGGAAYRKYDLEAWMPGRGEAGEYGEVTSTSNCTDYQARRLGIRYRRKGHKGTQFVHTLNGTAVAVSRALIAVLENYQEADGSVTIPAALRPYMGGQERITPPAK